MEVILEMIVALNAAVDAGATPDSALCVLALMIAERVQAEFAAGRVSTAQLRHIRRKVQHIGRRCKKLRHGTWDAIH